MASLMTLIDIDQYLFSLINGEWTNGFMDYILPIWRDKYFWIPVYFFIVFYMIFNYGKKGYWFVLFLLLTVASTDMASSQLIKKSVQRLRPCRAPEISGERVLVTCGHGYSFTSSHAANHFAISMFLIFTLAGRYKKVLPLCLFWAISVAYGQVYVGVHFPLDVLCGALLGGLIAYLGSQLYQRSGDRVLDWIRYREPLV